VYVAAENAPKQLEQAGIDSQAGGSDADVLWWKLARQGPIAVLTSVLRKPIGELRSDPRFRLAVEEACAVAAADGARTTFDEQWAIIETLPGWATSSTERDVTAGRPSELDHIGGGIVRAGRRHGVPTPTLEQLLEQCPA
jgi:2-dehydropantoate 2-reductase